MICGIISSRLGVDVSVAEVGLAGREAAEAPLEPASAVDRAAALWRGEVRNRIPHRVVSGSGAAAPVWEWENPPDEVELTRAAGRPLDSADVTALRRIRVHYQEMYRRVGGGPVAARLAAVLNDRAEPLLRASYDNDLGRRLYRAVGGLAALAGICAYDADRQALAQRHLFVALRFAKASGDRTFGAYVVAVLANQALLEEHRLVVQYVESALRTTGPVLGPALASDLHALAGKAYARMGDVSACHAHLRSSKKAAAHLDESRSQTESSYVQEGLVETQAAEALRRLGDLRAARTYAEESIRSATSTHARGQVHRHAGLALVLAAQGELEHSVQVADRMFDCALGMESGRVRDRVNQVIRSLRPHLSEPVVAAFIERANEHTGSNGV